MVVFMFAAGACGEEEKPTIIFSDLNWDSAQIQNAIAARIVSAGYGYPTDKVFGGTVPLMEALTRGDTNVTLEIWLPNQKEAYDQAIAEGTIEVVGNSLEDNWQSAFIVPKYVTDANPGLSTVQDLRDHMDLFVTPDSNGKARLLNCPPGWECEVTNTKQVAGYGLDDVIELVNPGSGEALEAEIRASFEKEEPVLFYYWGPTTLSNALSSEYGGYTLLEEPPLHRRVLGRREELRLLYSAGPYRHAQGPDRPSAGPSHFLREVGLQRGQPAGGGGLPRRVGRELFRRRGQVPAEQLGVEELGHLRRGLQG